MAEPIRDASSLQKQLSEFQDVQRQLQMVSAQRQQMLLQLEEVKMAEEEISKSEKGIYRAIGPLLVESSKSEANADLKERKELFEMRISVLEKQEAKLKPRFEELRGILEKALSQGRAK